MDTNKGIIMQNKEGENMGKYTKWPITDKEKTAIELLDIAIDFIREVKPNSETLAELEAGRRVMNMTKYDFLTCEMCGKDSADKEGYCAECDYTTHYCGDECRFHGCQPSRGAVNMDGKQALIKASKDAHELLSYIADNIGVTTPHDNINTVIQDLSEALKLAGEEV